MQNDRDVIAQWAAEEFVAAGRKNGQEERLAHRRRAEFLSDICCGLQSPPAQRRRRRGRLSRIGRLLAMAFR